MSPYLSNQCRKIFILTKEQLDYYIKCPMWNVLPLGWISSQDLEIKYRRERQWSITKQKINETFLEFRSYTVQPKLFHNNHSNQLKQQKNLLIQTTNHVFLIVPNTSTLNKSLCHILLRQIYHQQCLCNTHPDNHPWETQWQTEKQGQR